MKVALLLSGGGTKIDANGAAQKKFERENIAVLMTLGVEMFADVV